MSVQRALAIALLALLLFAVVSCRPWNPEEPPVLPTLPQPTPPPGLSATTYYVRVDGGSSQQCTGLVDAPYPGSGTGQPCAWDHPFRALPPEGPPRMAGGDALIVAAGNYPMGYGAPGADNCESDYPWDCYMAAVPSGPDPAHPTRILGAGWDDGCPNPPALWGTERAYSVLNLAGSSNVEIACLEVTDHEGCVEFHSGGLACKRDAYPYGDWASIGLYAEDSANVHLADLDIHGLADAGVLAGRLTDWTVEDVRIAGNGWAGWNGDLEEGDSSNGGTLVFRRWTVEWNGCGETYPGEQPTGCWAQSAGGYGDGVGTGETGGHWVIEDSAFRYNTSDGLDLLYTRRPGSSITIRRTIAVGNAGNPIKTNGPTTIENSIVVANCGYFEGQAFTYQVDNCRAEGNALALNLQPGDQVTVTNNTVTGEGDCLAEVICEGSCDGSESVVMRNNIFLGQTDFDQPFEQTCWVYQENFPSDPLDADYSVITDVKGAVCPVGPHDICARPDLVSEGVDTLDAHLLSSSPAIDAGQAAVAPAGDFAGNARDAQPDIGAYEYGASPPPATATPAPTGALPTATPTPGGTIPPASYLPALPKGPSPSLSPTPTAGPTSPPGEECPAYPADLCPVTGTALYPEPTLAEPPPRQWFRASPFDTCQIRVTDRDNDLAPDDPSAGLTNEYARVQSFNADGSRLLVRGTEGTWYLYDAQTSLPLVELPLEVEPRWDAADPNLIYYTDGTRLLSYNVASSVTTQLRDFAGDLPGQDLAAVWTRYEGRPSADSRYWGLMAQDESWDTVAFLVYDRQDDQVVARDVRGVPGVLEGIDHVTISPSGEYFLASFDRYCDPGQLGSDADPCGLMVYNADLTGGRGLLRVIGHYDVALDAAGREVVVYQDIDTDHISMLDLASGAVTPLWPIDFSHTAIGLHFSGLAYDRPGWAVVSTYDDTPGAFTWMDDQVFLVELQPDGRVVRLAHTHSLRGDYELDYWAEPRASVNADLTRVIFTTNWGRTGTGEVEVVEIRLPPDWPERLPRK